MLAAASDFVLVPPIVAVAAQAATLSCPPPDPPDPPDTGPPSPPTSGPPLCQPGKQLLGCADGSDTVMFCVPCGTSCADIMNSRAREVFRGTCVH